MAFLFDGSFGAANGASLNTGGSEGTGVGADVGTTFYLNGLATPTTSVKANMQNVLSTWHHAVFVLTRQIADSQFGISLLNYAGGCAGSNIIIGRVSVYSTVLSQSDITNNYNAGF